MYVSAARRRDGTVSIKVTTVTNEEPISSCNDVTLQ